MMRSALNAVGGHSEVTAMIGDRMDTDIVAGIEAGLETFLVLTGVTAREQAEVYPFRPSGIIESVAAVAVAIVGLIHLVLTPEQLKAEAYVGVLFIVGGLAALYVAVRLWTTPDT